MAHLTKTNARLRQVWAESLWNYDFSLIPHLEAQMLDSLQKPIMQRLIVKEPVDEPFRPRHFST